MGRPDPVQLPGTGSLSGSPCPGIERQLQDVYPAGEIVHLVGLPDERVQTQPRPAHRPYPDQLRARVALPRIFDRHRATATGASIGPCAGDGRAAALIAIIGSAAGKKIIAPNPGAIAVSSQEEGTWLSTSCCAKSPGRLRRFSSPPARSRRPRTPRSRGESSCPTPPGGRRTSTRAFSVPPSRKISDTLSRSRTSPAPAP